MAGLAAGSKNQELLAHGARILIARGANAQRGPRQPAGRQLAALNPNAGSAFVWKTAIVGLGNGVKTDQVLDNAGEGGDVVMTIILRKEYASCSLNGL